MNIKIQVIFALFLLLFLGNRARVNAQCYGVVHMDSKADTGGTTGNTFTIVTARPNELILIGYNGWPSPSDGPVTVDGDTATHINTAHISNSAVSEVYAYSASLAGTHTIVCSESSYSSPYYLNFAASFYVTGSCIPLSCNNLITTETSVDAGDNDTDIITTTTPNEMIYCSAVYNTGIFPGNKLFLKGVTTLDTMHEGNGIDASVGDTTATIAGTYTVTTSDVNSCCGGEIALVAIVPPLCGGALFVSSVPSDSACAGQSVTISASGAKNYLWSTGSTDSTITVIIPQGDTAYYGVKGTGACIDSIPVKIKIIPTITATINAPNDSICAYRSITITAKGIGGQATYRWNTGATTASITVTDSVTTTYTATVYGLCDSTQVIKKIIVIPLPKPTISGSPWTCKGAKDTLTVSSPNNPTTYIWNNGKTGASIITGNINDDTIVTVTAYNSLGCSVTNTFPITVRPYPGGTISYPPGCGNSPTTITATGSGTGPFTYKWNTGGTYDTINILLTDSTTYSVVISNGCPVTKTVKAIPEIPALSACCNTTIFIDSNTTIYASGATLIKYQWKPDNNTLNCDTCATVIATPTVTTTYTITGTDAGGCQSQRFVTIVVDIPCFDFKVPNVFTPTNAGILGLDNIFYIKTHNLDAWSIVVYDRWGKEVYKGTNPDEYWNGNTESGSKALEGVYYYVINATCQGTTFQKDGFVQLIR